MKPPERFPPDDPREWLNRARSNLALAKNRIPGAYLEDLCFEAQQAAEKSIKAVMVMRNIAFPHVHDLARLVSLIEEAGEAVPEVLLEAERLTIYAVITRYPGGCQTRYRTGVHGCGGDHGIGRPLGREDTSTGLMSVQSDTKNFHTACFPGSRLSRPLPRYSHTLGLIWESTLIIRIGKAA